MSFSVSNCEITWQTHTNKIHPLLTHFETVTMIETITKIETITEIDETRWGSLWSRRSQIGYQHRAPGFCTKTVGRLTEFTFIEHQKIDRLMQLMQLIDWLQNNPKHTHFIHLTSEWRSFTTVKRSEKRWTLERFKSRAVSQRVLRHRKFDETTCYTSVEDRSLSLASSASGFANASLTLESKNPNEDPEWIRMKNPNEPNESNQRRSSSRQIKRRKLTVDSRKRLRASCWWSPERMERIFPAIFSLQQRRRCLSWSNDK